MLCQWRLKTLKHAIEVTAKISISHDNVTSEVGGANASYRQEQSDYTNNHVSPKTLIGSVGPARVCVCETLHSYQLPRCRSIGGSAL